MSKEGREERGEEYSLVLGWYKRVRRGGRSRERSILWFGLVQVSKEGREERGEEYSLVWAGTSE